MKYINLFFLSFVMMFMINSCSENINVAETGNIRELQIDAGIQSTSRAIKEGESFETGDEIGVFVPQWTSLVTKATLDDTWCLDRKITINEGDKVAVYAYYPYNSEKGSWDDKKEFQVPVDISNDVRNGQADYLWGKAEASLDDPVARINFNHTLARLSIKVRLDEADHGEGVLSDVTLENVGANQYVSTKGYLNLHTGEVVANYDDKESLFLLMDSLNYSLSKDKETTIDMLVMPMSLPKDSLVQLRLAIDGASYTIPLKAQNLEAGKRYFYPITIKRPNEDNSYKYDGVEMVDLGLSVKWCSHNVGAKEPTDRGVHYTWGGLQEKGHSQDDPYCSDLDNISNTDYDIAHVSMGGKWRIPTKEECLELMEKCTWLYNLDLRGYTVIGPNDNKLFIPCAGSMDKWGGSWVYSTYWMSEARDKDNAYIMDVDSEWIDYKVELSYMNKVCGGTIRPVSD